MISKETLITFLLIVNFLAQKQNFWLDHSSLNYAIVFFGLFLYLVFDHYSIIKPRKELWEKFKGIVLSGLICLIVIGSWWGEIYKRHISVPEAFIHGESIQIESAVNYLLQGKNPYKETYFDTPLEKWPYMEDGKIATNPALYHFNIPPFYLLSETFIYFISISTLFWYDARFLLLILFVGLLILTYYICRKRSNRLLLLSVVSFNPAFSQFFIEGRTDLPVFFWLILSFVLLKYKKVMLSSAVLALVFASKQSAWPILPFYIAYLYFNLDQKLALKIKILKTAKLLLPFVLLSTILYLPFFLWDKTAFINSIYYYINGGIPTSYPVSGFGFSRLLLSLNVIKNSSDYYPFWIWQLSLGLPTLFILLKKQAKDNNLSRMIFNYGLFLSVFWFLSRYFNDNHLVFITMIFASAYFFSLEKVDLGKTHRIGIIKG